MFIRRDGVLLTNAHVVGTVPTVTVRLADGLPSLRRGDALMLVLAALSASSDRHGMRIIHYSVQGNHLHLLVEAGGGVPTAPGGGARTLYRMSS